MIEPIKLPEPCMPYDPRDVYIKVNELINVVNKIKKCVSGNPDDWDKPPNNGLDMVIRKCLNEDMYDFKIADKIREWIRGSMPNKKVVNTGYVSRYQSEADYENTAYNQALEDIKSKLCGEKV
jgi:hypothetical protein